jgi:hypothetical protein
MTLNIVLRSPVLGRPYEEELCCITVDAVPYVLGALRLRMWPYWYTTDADYVRGRSLLAELSAEVLMPYGRDIVNAIDRVYNLIDAGLNGIGRSVAGDGTELDPYVYTPSLVQAPQPSDYSAPSLREDTDVARKLLNNLVNGTASSVASDTRSFRDQLQSIYDAIVAIEGEEGPTAQQVAQIISIIGAL